MSSDWFKDVHDMHVHYGFHERLSALGPEKLADMLEFRKKFLAEEMNELETAETPHDVVDALIDLCVVAIGTLDLYEVNGHLAWDRVHRANMNKRVGIKESRPNPLGLPDLIKPNDWVAPDHDDNVGSLSEFFKEDA